MLDFKTFGTQPLAEGEWEVLVEENPHDTFLTAGGRCSAMYAA